MNMRTRLKRGAIGAMLALMVFGAGAFADTSEVPVSVGVVTGQRTLQVTGADGTTVGGPAVLAFGSTASQAPFGTIVTDLAYERVGYDVYATLSHLYPLSGTSVDCSKTPIPASAFAVDVPSENQPGTTGVDAALESLLELTDDVNDDIVLLEGVLGGVSLTDDTVTLTDIPGLVESVRTTFEGTGVISTLENIVLMNTTPGDGGPFSSQDAHPASGCDSTGADDPDEVYLQTGNRRNPTATELASLTSGIFDVAVGGDGELTVQEAMDNDLLPLNSKETGSTVYSATETAVTKLLDDADVLDLVDVEATTKKVVDDLVAGVGDLALSVVAQSGVYPNVQTLTLNRDAMGAPTTGTYHGVMTVTLIDDPTNDGP